MMPPAKAVTARAKAKLSTAALVGRYGSPSQRANEFPHIRFRREAIVGICCSIPLRGGRARPHRPGQASEETVSTSSPVATSAVDGKPTKGAKK
jgi:hypothetical protein